MTSIPTTTSRSQNGASAYSHGRRIIQAIINLTETCIDPSITEQKQRERIKGRSSDIRRLLNRLNEDPSGHNQRICRDFFSRSGLNEKLDKLDEKIAVEPLLQDSFTMFDALKKLAAAVGNTPRELSYELSRILAWTKYHEQTHSKLHPNIPTIDQLSTDLNTVIARAHDHSSIVTLSPKDVDTYVAAHSAIALLKSRALGNASMPRIERF